jgi:predicted nucleic acid-binding protein/plasmid stability protein
MATLTIKNVPDPLVRRLKNQAALHRRSLNLEVIACLEAAAQAVPLDPEILLARVRAVRRSPARGRLTQETLRQLNARPAVIVADTNLVVYLFVSGPWTPGAEAVLVQDPVWVLPLLWRSEFRNTMSGLVRRRDLALEDALVIVAEAERTLAGREYAVTSHDVLRLAVRSGCSAYDCEFVALAEDLGTRLVTTDRQILRAFPAVAVAPDRFVA